MICGMAHRITIIKKMIFIYKGNCAIFKMAKQTTYAPNVRV